MENLKHTPGPWKTSVTRYNIPTQVHSDKIYICDTDVHTPYSDIGYEEREYNAKLIAAAPDLLESLMGLNHLMSGKEDWPEVERALSAIKKATK